jgi:hypothetical protein
MTDKTELDCAAYAYGLSISLIPWRWFGSVSEGVEMMKTCWIPGINMMKCDSVGYSFPVTSEAV